MNERAIELYLQASEFAYTTIGRESADTAYFQGTVAGKFAELIIQECLLCCERVISDPVSQSQDTWLNGGLQCMEEIKHNFGVEDLQNTIVSNHS